MKSLNIIISGKVQGVFFRANVKSKANELGISGYAKNLENRDVEIIAEGDESKIKELIDFIKKGPGMARIDKLDTKETAIKNFKSFEIKY